ncbi:MAG: hypothetical protein U5R06_03690 [candidate division KSB1 bacterium]|nr:hypothetical protein [candidate division KSB1 bacterium]
MTNITLKETHDLLEKLADYVMNEVPTRRELDKRFSNVNKRLEGLEQVKAEKSELKRVDRKADMLLEPQDGMVKSLDIIQTEIKAISRTLDNHEKRLADLEEHNVRSRPEVRGT